MIFLLKRPRCLIKGPETGFSKATGESWPIQKVQWKRKESKQASDFIFPLCPGNILVWWLLWGYWERWDGWQYHSSYPVSHFWGFWEPRSSYTEVLWHELSSLLREESWPGVPEVTQLKIRTMRQSGIGKIAKFSQKDREIYQRTGIKPHNLTVTWNQAPALSSDTEVWCKS